MKNILIPEDIPSSNKGEAALFYGLKETLKVFEPMKILLFSVNPEEDRRNYGDEAHVIDSRGITPGHILDGRGTKLAKLKNYLAFFLKHLCFLTLYMFTGRRVLKILRREVWQAYLTADIVVMSHDSIFAIFYHGLLFRLFALLRKPTAVFAGTIVPPHAGKSSFERAFRNWLTGVCLKRASVITLREDLSQAYLKGLGVNGRGGPPVVVYPDLAFLVKPVPEERSKYILKGEGLDKIGKPLVGLAVSQRTLELAFPGLARKDRMERAVNVFAELVDFIIEQLGACVVFVPHSIGPSRKVDDRVTADWISGRSRNADGIVNVRGDYNSREIKGLAGHLDMTVGTRLHFTIDATSMSVPSLLITGHDDFRCHGIIGKMLGQHEYLYDIAKMDSRSLISLTKGLWDKRELIRRDLAERILVIKEQAYQHGVVVRDVCENLGKQPPRQS